ncbi:MAG TPA: sigma-70 family RNA polymerase sigma factor [Polyangium sp.]|nr:sigma-70 family RNA polymerase sigma factor [Polyangium sp.]
MPSLPPPGDGRVKPEFSPFGLSEEQLRRVSKRMLAMAKSVGRHSRVCPEDIVQRVWETALSKPEEEWKSIPNEQKLVSYMCTLVRLEHQTLRRTQYRRQRQDEKAAHATQKPAAEDPRDAIEARDLVARVIRTLKKARDQNVARALFLEGKTNVQVAKEQKLSENTVSAHKKRLWKLIWARIQALLVVLWLFVPKKARAFVAQMTHQVPYLTSVMAVTGVCGVLVPTGSSVATEPSTLVSLTAVTTKRPNTSESAILPASFVPEVAPDEQKELDAETNTCSSADMKSTKFASILQETVVPLALVAATSVTQAACAGSNPQTPRVQQPAKERDDSLDPYDMYCVMARGRGETCITREEFNKY